MSLNRRDFLFTTAAASMGGAQGVRLDRKVIVTRHNPTNRSFDARAPLSVGNGEFAFTVDATGMQSFPDLYEKQIPLCTQSQWGWHSVPAPGLNAGDLVLQPFDTYGRAVGYPTSAKGQEKLFNWLRENPHRLHLGRIGLADATPSDITDIEQTLDLWSGVIRSSFSLRGRRVSVETCCHPSRDAVAIAVASELPDIAISIEFPYGSPSVPAAEWKSPDRHRSAAKRKTNRIDIERELDADRYSVCIAWTGAVEAETNTPHRIVLKARKSLSLAVEFAPLPINAAPLNAAHVFEASTAYWPKFWQGGGAIDLSGSRDQRAQELERRVVLSQYLTAIQCSGSMPPQETGLTCNSWYGKFHLEMHWWHAAHFAQWNRAPMLERSLDWYGRILPSARDKARQQGYTGCRWPKMVGPDGRDSPSGIGPLLIWQQPHPIAMAELCYRASPSKATLAKFRDIVLESAEFMASFVHYEEARGRYVLGPPVIPAQENHPPRETWNPTYELAYWKYGLELAQQWRRRLGMKPEPKWAEVAAKLSPYPVKDGVYLAHENCPNTFTERNRDHPSMLAAYGVLDGQGIDREIMRNTLRRTFRDWRWPDTWGWDFPVVAMCAARLDEPALAIDALFIDSPKNTWLKNGHNWQRANLPLYLPGNGGLLAAVAMMASGWKGAPSRNAPGFPTDKWQVRHEGLVPPA